MTKDQTCSADWLSGFDIDELRSLPTINTINSPEDKLVVDKSYPLVLLGPQGQPKPRTGVRQLILWFIGK